MFVMINVFLHVYQSSPHVALKVTNSHLIILDINMGPSMLVYIYRVHLEQYIIVTVPS